MKHAILIREYRSDYGTEGWILYEVSGIYKSLFTMEPTWKNNRSNLSCIPAGVYKVKIVRSKKYGLVFLLEGVQGRFAILIHSGNFGGDVEKGFITHTEGCLLFGKYRGISHNQRAVLNSKIAISEFMRDMPEEFTLTIIDPLLKEAI